MRFSDTRHERNRSGGMGVDARILTDPHPIHGI